MKYITFREAARENRIAVFMNDDSSKLSAQKPSQPSRIGRSALVIHGISILAMIVAGVLLSRRGGIVRGEAEAMFVSGAVSLSAALVLWGWSLVLTARSLQARENPDCATIILAAAGLEFVLVLTMIG
jgi:hypothetical protein